MRDVRKVHILLHFLLYNNTYVVQILSVKIYISSEHIYQKLLNCDLHGALLQRQRRQIIFMFTRYLISSDFSSHRTCLGYT
jgi:hypothetical protein